MQVPNLPEMVVEQRESKTAHDVPAPDLSEANMSAQFEDALKLNDAAKLYKYRQRMYEDVDAQLYDLAWTDDTLDTLTKYIGEYVPGLMHDEIIAASQDVLQCAGFDQVAHLVRDDMCSEVFNLMLQYCHREGQKHQRERDFIDGSGIGYLQKFTQNLRSNIEKSFDAKYFYKVMRPLAYAWERYGVNLVSLANKVHPGHWSYPQGHSTKSFTAVQTLGEVFHLDDHCRRQLMIAACLFGHGRDGNLIHFPMDTYAAGYNTKLKEFAV